MRFDDDYVSSEVFRLMPPPQSELRQALDAANGTAGDPLIVVSPNIGEARRPSWAARKLQAAGRACQRWLKRNTRDVVVLTIATVVGGLILAVILAHVHP